MSKILKLKFLIFFLFGLNSLLFATTKINTFEKFSNDYFVESGSYEGESIQRAQKAEFQHIYSIEISKKYYDICKKKFSYNPNIKLFLGDSGDILYEVIKNIDSTITFWLDGHYSGGATGKGKSNTPILRELDQIKKHPIKNHTILIDDMADCNTPWFDYVTRSQIIGKIKEINPNYEISYIDGFYRKNDVLVAQIK